MEWGIVSLPLLLTVSVRVLPSTVEMPLKAASLLTRPRLMAYTVLLNRYRGGSSEMESWSRSLPRACVSL